MDKLLSDYAKDAYSRALPPNYKTTKEIIDSNLYGSIEIDVVETPTNDVCSTREFKFPLQPVAFTDFDGVYLIIPTNIEYIDYGYTAQIISVSNHDVISYHSLHIETKHKTLNFTDRLKNDKKYYHPLEIKAINYFMGNKQGTSCEIKQFMNTFYKSLEIITGLMSGSSNKESSKLFGDLFYFINNIPK